MYFIQIVSTKYSNNISLDIVCSTNNNYTDSVGDSVLHKWRERKKIDNYIILRNLFKVHHHGLITKFTVASIRKV